MNEKKEETTLSSRLIYFLVGYLCNDDCSLYEFLDETYNGGHYGDEIEKEKSIKEVEKFIGELRPYVVQYLIDKGFVEDEIFKRILNYILNDIKEQKENCSKKENILIDLKNKIGGKNNE